MSRFARNQRVYFFEEPVFDVESGEGFATIHTCEKTGVRVIVPHLAKDCDDVNHELSGLLEDIARRERIENPVAWLYTPMALEFLPNSIEPCAVVYDCMDELSQFRGAPPKMLQMEEALLRRADVVFTGGVSLYEAKQNRHWNVHAMPSGVDVHHFKAARDMTGSQLDEMQEIPRPRIGYAGVIDERIDLELIDALAAADPNWQIVLIGPVVKISEDQLPRRHNIQWLGMKPYADLPKYFAEWDVAMMPFALNEATQYISPTKTPEYLAAGLPVVSTAIRDVVRPYGEAGIVRIADSIADFVEHVEEALKETLTNEMRTRIDAHLQRQSWDSVWNRMAGHITKCLIAKERREVAHV
ncbi:glycosyl transferase [Bryobacterales bacterium F-183]|nr:glycosyl transferase [Bryobacterales bacterium F-183]